jgi:hypothetical protein
MSGTIQQINLYQPATGASSGGPFSASTALRVCVIVIGCMLIVWGYGLWRIERLQREVGDLHQQQQRQQDTMAALNAARDLGATPEQIEARVKELTAELAAHTRALDMLRDGSVGETGGFSKRLAALAGHPVAGLWVDHVVLSGTTRSMAIGGAAVSPELIPQFFRGLGGEAALAGIRFDQLVIERPRAASPTGELPTDPTPRESFRFRAGDGALLQQAGKEPAS